MNGSYTDDYLPTISEEFETGIFLEVEDKLKRFDLVFRDFGGELKTFYSELYRDEILSADGFILIHAKEIAASFPAIIEMVADIRNIEKHHQSSSSSSSSSSSILVLENKHDQKNPFDDLKVTQRSFEMHGVLNYEGAVSAKTNSNIEESIAFLVKDIDKKHA